jgi:hypothetical protein
MSRAVNAQYHLLGFTVQFFVMSPIPQTRKWYQIQWFQPDDTKEERKLISKLDLLIVPYVFLAYWVKYIDQANISM